MIAWNTKCRSCINHSHDELQHFWNPRPAVYKITNKDSPSTIRRNCPSAFRLVLESITKACKKCGEFLIAPVNIADDVEWPVLMLEVVPQRLTRDRDSGNFIR